MRALSATVVVRATPEIKIVSPCIFTCDGRGGIVGVAADASGLVPNLHSLSAIISVIATSPRNRRNHQDSIRWGSCDTAPSSRPPGLS